MPFPLPPPVAALERSLGLEPGSLKGADLARATQALEDATVLALAEAPPAVAARWAADAPALVDVTIRKAARREYENPRGLAAENLGEHGFSLSETSGVYLTAREVALVRRAARGRAGGFVGTVRTPSAYEAAHELYVDVLGGGDPLPWPELGDLE
ncbi:hypothetical protein ACWFQT_20345 [Cellulosimicrobium cellulans]